MRLLKSERKLLNLVGSCTQGNSTKGPTVASATQASIYTYSTNRQSIINIDKFLFSFIKKRSNFYDFVKKYFKINESLNHQSFES